MSRGVTSLTSGVDATRNIHDESLDGDERSREPALLFALILYWALVIALVMSIVGLVLAVAGFFYPIVLLLIGVPATAILGIAASGPFRLAASELIRGGILPVAAVLLILVASALSAGVFSAEHLMTDRDPGVYAATGRWLADEGTLLMSGTVGGFADIEHVSAESPEFFDTRGDGTIDPQFLHLLPVWAAAAHWVGGDQALLRVNAVVIALALASVWLFCATMTRPWFAVLATGSVAIMLPTVHFARDLYTEPMAMLFVFAGLAFLRFARQVPHPALAFIAGLSVGAGAMVRIDGWLIITAVVAYLLAERWAAQHSGLDETISGFVQPALMGILVSGSVGMFDAAVRSRPYVVIRASEISMMFAVLILVVLIGVIALRWPEPVRRLVAWVDRHRGPVAWLVPVVIVVAAALLFFARPIVEEVHRVGTNAHVEAVQRYEGIEVDGTRTYYEWTMHWLSWYLGVFGLALGVIGIAWASRKAILGVRHLWPYLLVISLTAAVFVIRPSVTPDQLWAIRRFLPVVLPGLIIAAALATQWAVQGITRPVPRWGAIAAAVGILIVLPALYTWPLRMSTSYDGMYDAFEDICSTVPEGSAVLMTSRSHANLFQVPVRSFCGVPVSGIRDADADRPCVIAAVNKAWADRGVNLIVGYGNNLELEPRLSIDRTHQVPEFTLTRRPNAVMEQHYGINFADADDFDTSECAS